MIDLHNHILSQIDDGAQSLAESLVMAEIAAANGIKTIVATPHTQNGKYINEPDCVESAIIILQKVIDNAGIDLKILPGVESCLIPDLAEYILKNKVATINKSRYILLELPGSLMINACKQEIFSLRVQGFVPIIAHPERHPLIQKDIGLLFDLVKMGCLCQITAESIVGGFGRKVKNTVKKIAQAQLAHIVASDAHSAKYRPPILNESIDRLSLLLGSQKKAVNMVTETPDAVINNEIIDIPISENCSKNIFTNFFFRNILQTVDRFRFAHQ